MFCRNCGKEMSDKAAVCVQCGVKKGTGSSYCPNCGNETAKGAAVCLKCGVSLNGADHRRISGQDPVLSGISRLGGTAWRGAAACRCTRSETQGQRHAEGAAGLCIRRIQHSAGLLRIHTAFVSSESEVFQRTGIRPDRLPVGHCHSCADVHRSLSHRKSGKVNSQPGKG